MTTPRDPHPHPYSRFSGLAKGALDRLESMTLEGLSSPGIRLWPFIKDDVAALTARVKELEQAETMVAYYEETFPYLAKSGKLIHDLKDKLKEAEAEAERLKCCGNCRELMSHLLLCKLEPEDDEGNISERRCYESCQFTPSRWTVREEGSE